MDLIRVTGGKRRCSDDKGPLMYCKSTLPLEGLLLISN